MQHSTIWYINHKEIKGKECIYVPLCKYIVLFLYVIRITSYIVSSILIPYMQNYSIYICRSRNISVYTKFNLRICIYKIKTNRYSLVHTIQFCNNLHQVEAHCQKIGKPNKLYLGANSPKEHRLTIRNCTKLVMPQRDEP